MKNDLFLAVALVGLMAAVGAFLGFLLNTELLGALLGCGIGLALLPIQDPQDSSRSKRSSASDSRSTGD